MAVMKAEGETPPIAIQRTVTTIGFSNQCTIQLTDGMSHGRVCTAQAGNHAAIVFDKVRFFRVLGTFSGPESHIKMP